MGKSRQKRFDRIKNETQNAKNKNKFVVLGGNGDCIDANDSYQLIQNIENGETTHEETLKEIFKINIYMALKDLMSWQRLIRIKPIC